MLPLSPFARNSPATSESAPATIKTAAAPVTGPGRRGAPVNGLRRRHTGVAERGRREVAHGFGPRGAA